MQTGVTGLLIICVPSRFNLALWQVLCGRK